MSPLTGVVLEDVEDAEIDVVEMRDHRILVEVAFSLNKLVRCKMSKTKFYPLTTRSSPRELGFPIFDERLFAKRLVRSLMKEGTERRLLLLIMMSVS